MEKCKRPHSPFDSDDHLSDREIRKRLGIEKFSDSSKMEGSSVVPFIAADFDEEDYSWTSGRSPVLVEK
jgi:hypothetical protein